MFLSSLLNTAILACVAIALIIILRLMCNSSNDALRKKILRIYDVLFKTLGIVTGVAIIIYLCVVFMNIEPFLVWFQNLITLMCIILVTLSLLAKRKN